jgi:hypothetical protein
MDPGAAYGVIGPVLRQRFLASNKASFRFHVFLEPRPELDLKLFVLGDVIVRCGRLLDRP